ncbi:hypothetical protein HMPREF0972_01046 [Actinomyces sp. oral taxon 848 str. F0332]|nr:hypothetical protein HMPREF0972_01046 [Actinomyces sp. oral taxon 848 str. F0332]
MNSISFLKWISQFIFEPTLQAATHRHVDLCTEAHTAHFTPDGELSHWQLTAG